jgi:cyanophycinase-like exopeptidase
MNSKSKGQLIITSGAEEVLSIYDVKLHVLSRGDCFDLVKRQPTYAILEEKDSQKPPVAKTG